MSFYCQRDNNKMKSNYWTWKYLLIWLKLHIQHPPPAPIYSIWRIPLLEHCHFFIISIPIPIQIQIYECQRERKWNVRTFERSLRMEKDRIVFRMMQHKFKWNVFIFYFNFSKLCLNAVNLNFRFSFPSNTLHSKGIRSERWTLNRLSYQFFIMCNLHKSYLLSSIRPQALWNE